MVLGYDDFEKNTIKILMLLNSYTRIYKKKKKVNGGVVTEVYMAFKNIKVPELSNRLDLNAILQPYTLCGDYLVGASHLSRQKIIKKSKKQKKANDIDSKAALLASQLPVTVDSHVISKINHTVCLSVAKKYNIKDDLQTSTTPLNTLLSILMAKKNMNTEYLQKEGLYADMAGLEAELLEMGERDSTVSKKFKKKANETEEVYKKRFII
jgi:hypothetical protein